MGRNFAPSIFWITNIFNTKAPPISPDRPVDHERPLSDTIHELLGIKEVGLLEKAAEAVGERGLTGKNTPATLPFFFFALQVTQLAEGTHYSNATTHKDETYLYCADSCPPCSHDECIGLCGKGCTCWRWVCGDCCWHAGCYDHDMCCNKSWLQLCCLLPKVVFKFYCDKHYKC